MGLMMCPDCGDMVSDHAFVCPKCGFPHLEYARKCPLAFFGDFEEAIDNRQKVFDEETQKLPEVVELNFMLKNEDKFTKEEISDARMKLECIKLEREKEWWKKKAQIREGIEKYEGTENESFKALMDYFHEKFGKNSWRDIQVPSDLSLFKGWT